MENQQQENVKDIQQQNENLKEQKQKQNILIFGGLGFVGKNYLLNLIKNQKYNKIITVDKQIPSLCIMPQTLKDAFNDNKIQHYQLDISQEKEVEKLFLEKLKDENVSYVVNLASETRFGFSSEHYQQKIANLAKFTAFYSNKIKVKKYVHFSSYFVYKKDLSQGKEDNEKNCDPVNKMGKYNLLAEKYVKEYENLNWVIIRPASIYGNFCETGITYRILGAIIYQFLDQPYRVLWDEKLRTQTLAYNIIKESYTRDKALNGTVQRKHRQLQYLNEQLKNQKFWIQIGKTSSQQRKHFIDDRQLN
ncbi:hypothetical protein PPERSA_00768 [Pseudocohnilembus persalinus]|uniref:NAD-dependent epimerase/dehydratase domain-containing protein n=1 Tax=Pseudocohnilembus persalinus TaxID=266149 RepID=A0A0V0Q9M6_PSEPJ|nr:hypothetical protein PPERSA_00768 [Pseudocohnilembus persalinus]|eukprot:KRW98941.1 hypothetical protein PPERSA_00768 [Pseudocohnilembus persalinus]